jgi:hypothetical protein
MKRKNGDVEVVASEWVERGSRSCLVNVIGVSVVAEGSRRMDIAFPAGSSAWVDVVTFPLPVAFECFRDGDEEPIA